MGGSSGLNKAHIACWILKDAFWCAQLAWPAMLMILPTILLNLIVIWRDREAREENTFLLGWILMNALWMMHELWQWPMWPVWVAMTIALTSLAGLVRGELKG